MKKIITFLFTIIPIFILAQNNSQYLEGVIPMIDGKITFSTNLNIPGMTQQQIFKVLYEWAQQRYQPDGKLNARILYQKPEKGNFVAGGEEYIIFSSTALSLDRTRIYYLMNVECEAEKCHIEITRIRYWYDEARGGGEKYTAEEWITDEIALNKTKTKLAPICGKFRKGTIDLKDQLFDEIQSVLSKEMVALGLSVSVTSSNQPQSTVTSESVPPINNNKENTNDFIKEIARITITAGHEEQIELSRESWGGINELYGKKIACCIIDTQKAISNLLMTQNDEYTLSFYSSDDQKPKMTLHCKKLLQQNITGEEAIKISPNCSADKSYNMYIGEIKK